jgi:Tol biopolymer transport system component
MNTFVDEGFRAPLENPRALRNVTDGDGYWEEHAVLSPGGGWISFNSSRLNPDVRYPPSAFPHLSMGIYVRPADLSAAPHLLLDLRNRLTARDLEQGVGLVTSDYDWSPDGTEIAVSFVRRAADGRILTQHIMVAELNSAY